MRTVNALVIYVLTLLPNNSCGLSLLTNTQYKAEGLEIYLRPDLSKYGPFSHACKMSDGKNYFAVLGASNGTIFVNYTNQNLEDGDIQFFPGAPSRWRECRSYHHPITGNTYAYVVTEGPNFKEYPGGIQIFKLGDKIELVNTYTDVFFNSAHTIFIDTEKGLAFVNGSRWQGNLAKDMKSHKDHLGGLRILDIKTDPEHPRNIGFYNKSYTHDSYALGMVDTPKRWKYNLATGQYEEIKAGKEYILFLADIYMGYIRVLSVSDPAQPILENSIYTPLYNQGVSVHNIWASENKKWLFATEETLGSSLLVYDINDPVNPRFVTAYRSEKVADNSIIHNVVIKNNIAYCSWYKEGVRLVDVSNPVHPKEIAFFDSSVKKFDSHDLFHGNWSVDVDDRNLIIISDIEEGLFILKLK